MGHWVVKVRVTTEDMDTGKLRSKTETYLVSAGSIEKAQECIKSHFRGTTMEHEIRGISKSGILEYIDANKKESIV